MQMGLGYDDISMKGIGYKEIIGSLEGKYTIDEAIELKKKKYTSLRQKAAYLAEALRQYQMV